MHNKAAGASLLAEPQAGDIAKYYSRYPLSEVIVERIEECLKPYTPVGESPLKWHSTVALESRILKMIPGLCTGQTLRLLPSSREANLLRVAYVRCKEQQGDKLLIDLGPNVPMLQVERPEEVELVLPAKVTLPGSSVTALVLTDLGLAIANAVELLADCVHRLHESRGWWKSLITGDSLKFDYPRSRTTGPTMLYSGRESKTIADTISLIHSEVSEAYEAHRRNLNDDKLHNTSGFATELADTMIRLLDASGGYSLYMGTTVAYKLAVNAIRPDHSVEARTAAGGKAT